MTPALNGQRVVVRLPAEGANSLNFSIRCLAAPHDGVFRFPSQINLASHGAS